jgi:hypothetical protein
VLEFVLAVEVVLDDALVAPGDEDEVFDAGRPGLVDHVLDHGSVDDRQHLLGHRLGRGQEPRTEAGDGEHGFADTSVGLWHRASFRRSGHAISPGVLVEQRRCGEFAARAQGLIGTCRPG